MASLHYTSEHHPGTPGWMVPGAYPWLPIGERDQIRILKLKLQAIEDGIYASELLQTDGYGKRLLAWLEGGRRGDLQR